MLENNDAMRLRSGRTFDPATPHLLQPTLVDIAYALAGVLRFGGHTTPRYTVLAHSLHVADLVIAAGHPAYELEALLHDAPEYVLGDMPSPVKAMLPDYRKLEARVQASITATFRLNVSEHCRAVIKEADNKAFALEWEAFSGGYEGGAAQHSVLSKYIAVTARMDKGEHLFWSRTTRLYTERVQSILEAKKEKLAL
jgi:5'-deoxynucleotidase YfbR-like HD superfamily hydrolase